MTSATWGTWLLYSMILAVAYTQNNNRRLVTIESGRVEGYKDAKTDVFVFHGIPYAKKPTGTDKYKAPLPQPGWAGTFKAQEMAAHPETYLEAKSEQTENSLLANIYVSDTKKKYLPVLINVYGEAYQLSRGNLATLKEFVKTKEIIVVNFNYRLGVHGFLCLGTKFAPGNAGMKDQVALLRWVKKNIAAFGGNPNEVTIAGHNAGASVVALLQLSPSAKGLFKRVILEDRSNLATFSMQVDPLEVAKKFAIAANLTNVDNVEISELENFYKTTTFPLISQPALNGPPLDPNYQFTQFTPCVERDLGEETFLKESPYDILRRGDYPELSMMFGLIRKKGIFMMENFDKWKSNMNGNVLELLPADLQFNSEKEKHKVGKAVRNFYYKDKAVYDDDDSVHAFINYYTDLYFSYSTMKSVRLQLKAGNNQIYLYEYSFVDDNDIQVLAHSKIRNSRLESKTMAVYDGIFIDSNAKEDKLTDKIKKIKATTRDLWHNFITKGKPVSRDSSMPAWPPMTKEGSPYMSIGETLEVRGRGPEMLQRMRFWDDIYNKYYRKPSPPVLSSSRDEL